MIPRYGVHLCEVPEMDRTNAICGYVIVNALPAIGRLLG